MAEKKQYIAVDLGAESGRVMLGQISDFEFELKKIYRFSNGPVEEDNSLRWDFNRLFSELKTGLAKAVKDSNGNIYGIGVNSWGADFGLIDVRGRLIENPYHYRDSRTDGMMEKAFELMPREDIYKNTGIQFMQLNTIYQLLAMREANSPALQQAHKLIFMADLVSYYLCDKVFAEYTLASTSGLMNMKTGQWAQEVFDRFSLSIDIMPEVISPGTIVGPLKSELADELGIEPIPVIAVGSHDTASAVAAVPAPGNNSWAYLSSGTWSLMGVEIPKPIIDENTLKYEFTNEGGVENTIRLLKNIMGLWLVQECRRQWQKEGEDLSYARLASLAREAKPFAAHINPNDSSFLSPGNMPAKINEQLSALSPARVEDKGQLIRAILESLAFYSRRVIERIEEITGQYIEVLHMVGGGIQNELLCQFTADAIGRKIMAGPIEATASGNVLMQAMAIGQIKSLPETRALIGNSFQLKEYLPIEPEEWNREYATIEKIFAL